MENRRNRVYQAIVLALGILLVGLIGWSLGAYGIFKPYPQTGTPTPSVHCSFRFEGSDGNTSAIKFLGEGGKVIAEDHTRFYAVPIIGEIKDGQLLIWRYEEGFEDYLKVDPFDRVPIPPVCYPDDLP